MKNSETWSGTVKDVTKDYVAVEAGKRYDIFIVGSLNGPPSGLSIGDTVTVVWVRTSTYALPFIKTP